MYNIRQGSNLLSVVFASIYCAQPYQTAKQKLAKEEHQSSKRKGFNGSCHLKHVNCPALQPQLLVWGCTAGSAQLQHIPSQFMLFEIGLDIAHYKQVAHQVCCQPSMNLHCHKTALMPHQAYFTM